MKILSSSIRPFHQTRKNWIFSTTFFHTHPSLKKIDCSQIKNHDKPICATCQYFQPAIHHLSKESAVEYGKCKYYGEMNILDGKVKYEYASIVRENDCGLEGRRHKYDKHYRWKYKNTYIQPFIVLASPFLFYLFLSHC